MASAIQCPSCGADLTGGGPAPTGGCPQCSGVVAAGATQTSGGVETMARDDARFFARLEGDATAELLLDVQVNRDAQPAEGQPTIWGYQITGPPMRGGMGTVWHARQLGTQRDVVVKTLASRQSPAARAMFV